MCGKLFKEEDTQNNTEDKNNSFQGKNLIYSLTCCDCCAPTSRKNLVYYHLKAVGYNEMACGMRRSVWKDKQNTSVFSHSSQTENYNLPNPVKITGIYVSQVNTHTFTLLSSSHCYVIKPKYVFEWKKSILRCFGRLIKSPPFLERK